MTVSVWNSVCASIRFSVTSCLGTCYPLWFYTWAAIWSIKGVVSISCFPLQIYSAGYLLRAVHSLHGKCFPSPSSPLSGCRLLARFVLLHWLVREICYYSIYGGDGRKYHLCRSRDISFFDHVVLVKVKNRARNLALCWELCRHFVAFTASSVCYSVNQYPFSAISSPEKVQISISCCISKQSTCKLFISINPHSRSVWNLSLPFIQKCLRNEILIHNQLLQCRLHKGEKREVRQYMLCGAKGCRAQSQDVHPFSVLQTNVGLKHHRPEALGAAPMQAVS